MCEQYLESYYAEAIIQILENVDENKHFSINIFFVQLFENDPSLANSLLKEPQTSLDNWDNAVKRTQTKLIEQSERNFVFKKNVHCRVFGLPLCAAFHRTIFPKNDDADKFLQVSGTVVRMTAIKLLESQRQYICVRCKYVMVVNAEYEKRNNIAPPRKCGNPEDCKGTNIISTQELNPDFCKDYQEIKIQEILNRLDVGCIPNSMWITLEDDLVDSCKPGDNITVCGIVKRRWSQLSIGRKMDIELVIKANYIQVNNNSSATSVTTDLKDMFESFWKTYSDTPLAARDIILKSICPQIFGLHIVKLAIAVTLAGGSHLNDNFDTGVQVRSEPHLLLVGDPGTGKSQLLRFASKIIPRSVLTTGVGSTAAGLTVTAVMEGGEWQLEAGALVLSDGGICCIDEFNSMKEHDRTSIHEAMEQQSISVAKASIVCKLSTRCSVLAATNPKGNLDPSQPLSMNIALASPLLSRFDLILLLRDKVNENWDSLVADYILNSQNSTSKLVENIYWTVEILQAYFASIKKIRPLLTDDSNKILSSYYQAQRRKGSHNKSRTTVRLLDSLVRLSQGHARLMFHGEVQIVDAVMAVILVETAMEADSSVFDLRLDVQNDFPDNPVKNYCQLVTTVLKKLQLNDLLEKELNSLNNKTSSTTTSINLKKDIRSPPVREFKKESKFFVAHNQANDNKTDSSEDELDIIKPVNTEKVRKLTKDNSKLNDDVINDLGAFDCMPSVLDVPFLSNSESDEEDLDLDLETQNGKRKQKPSIVEPQSKFFKVCTEIHPRRDEGKIENINEMNEAAKLNSPEKDYKKQANVTPKVRQLLNKYRFIPKESRNTIDNHEMIPKENTNHKEIKLVSENSLSPNNVSAPICPSNLIESEEIYKDFKTVPQSTQQPKWKITNDTKIHQNNDEIKDNNPLSRSISLSTKSSSTTIFESQEDLEDLDDLDL